MKHSLKFDGLLYAIGAFFWWGLAPLYWKLLPGVSPEELLTQRIIWSAVFLVPFLLRQRHRNDLGSFGWTDRKKMGVLFLSASLIGFNWYLYMTAITEHRVMEASLGYFLTPLVSVFLGVVFLRERLSPFQAVSLMSALFGVLFLTQSINEPPYLALLLSSSFALYGLLKARLKVRGDVSVAVETLLLCPIAIGYLYLKGQSHSLKTWMVLLSTGPFTVVPMIWYTTATQRIQYSTVGFLQFISPILQLTIAVTFLNEPFGSAQRVTFGLIGLGLMVFCWELAARLRKTRRTTQRSSQTTRRKAA